jgi:hypothetical protein
VGESVGGELRALHHALFACVEQARWNGETSTLTINLPLSDWGHKMVVMFGLAPYFFNPRVWVGEEEQVVEKYTWLPADPGTLVLWIRILGSRPLDCETTYKVTWVQSGSPRFIEGEIWLRK